MEDKYTEALVDEYTNLLSDDIPTVLTYLFYNYGKVSSEEVAQKEQEVMNTTWLPSDPIVLLTRPLEQLRKLAEHAGIPYSDTQILEKGLAIIRATRDFEYALTMWENKPLHSQTWPNFKSHFHEAQLNLKKIRGPTMQQAGYHQANMIAEKISTDIQDQLSQRDMQLLSMLQTLTTADQENIPPNQSVACTSQTPDTQLEILEISQELRSELVNIRHSSNKPNPQ